MLDDVRAYPRTTNHPDAVPEVQSQILRLGDNADQLRTVVRVLTEKLAGLLPGPVESNSSGSSTPRKTSTGQYMDTQNNIIELATNELKTILATIEI